MSYKLKGKIKDYVDLLTPDMIASDFKEFVLEKGLPIKIYEAEELTNKALKENDCNGN